MMELGEIIDPEQLTGCEKLVYAFRIFAEYHNGNWPTHCEHDVMYVNIWPSRVSPGEIELLEKLGFHADEDECHFFSHVFGSC